jgi:septation ring formation regulator EzrA
MKDVSKEVKQLRKESVSLRESNKKYKKALASMKFYLDKIGTAENLPENPGDIDSNSVSFISN